MGCVTLVKLPLQALHLGLVAAHAVDALGAEPWSKKMARFGAKRAEFRAKRDEFRAKKGELGENWLNLEQNGLNLGPKDPTE